MISATINVLAYSESITYEIAPLGVSIFLITVCFIFTYMAYYLPQKIRQSEPHSQQLKEYYGAFIEGYSETNKGGYFMNF